MEVGWWWGVGSYVRRDPGGLPLSFGEGMKRESKGDPLQLMKGLSCVKGGQCEKE